MEPWLLLFFDNQTALQVSSLVGFLLLAFFIFYFFSREGRDERGRKVTAIASLAAFIMLFVSMNVLSGFTDWASENPRPDAQLYAAGLLGGAFNRRRRHPDRPETADPLTEGTLWGI